MTADLRTSTQGTGSHSPEGASEPVSPIRSGAGIAGTTAIAYVVATALTEPVFVADTPDMAVSAVQRVLGLNCTFLEPGHLLWRPTGYAMLELFGTAKPGAATDEVLRVSQVQLGWAAWVAGLIAIVSGALWLRQRIGSVGALAFGTGVILLSKAFLNYSQVGASYMPALACLMVALVVLSKDSTPSYAAVVAGALLGLSVLMWGTFALALPAALASPFIFGTDVRRGLGRFMLAVTGGAVTAVAAAVWVSSSLGFDSAGQLAGWAATADHGISTSGFPRAVLGFARSYLETGDYGRLVKRFLIGDDADPVSMRDLLGFPLLGILGFYAGILAACITAFHHRSGRRYLAFFLVNAIPVMLFAIAWQGGDLERYLPLVPGMALLAATAFDAGGRLPRAVLAAWLVIIVVPTAIALGMPAVHAERERVRAGLRAVESGERRRLLVLSHWQDERVQFSRNYPPDADPLQVRFYHLLTPGTSSVLDWRRRAASRILAAWDAGTEVFVSERLVAPTPKREWAWVDGDDSRVAWRDLHDYFTALAYGPAMGTAGDGFLPLPPTTENRAALAAFVGAGSTGRSACSLPPTIPD